MPADAAERDHDTGLAAFLRGCPDPLAQVYDVALLDLDGVVYLGDAAVPGAPQALAKAADSGMRLAYVTNNSSRTPSAIAAQVAGFGVPATAGDVVTSAQAAATLLAGRLPAGSAVLVVGGNGLRAAVRERGFRPVSTALDRPAAVVQGFAPGIGYSLLCEGALAVQAGAWYVASNADATMPTGRGRQPGNGALCQVIVHSTGQQPVVAGKPEPPLHAEAVARTGARHPLVVGDRLDTDIEGAVRAGAPSLLVFTGVTRPEDAVLAAADQRPTYLAADLAGLLAPHPPIAAEQGVFRCGGWAARRPEDDSPLVLEGSGDAMDGLRALCAAAWSAGNVTAGADPPCAGCTTRLTPGLHPQGDTGRPHGRCADPAAPGRLSLRGRRASGPGGAKRKGQLNDRGPEPHETLRGQGRGGRPVIQRGARQDHRLPRPERGGQNHHHAAHPRARPPDQGHRHRARQELPRPGPADARGGRAAGRQGGARRPERLQPPALPGPDQQPARPPGR